MVSAVASNGHSCGGEYTLYFIQQGIVALEPFEVWERNLLQRTASKSSAKWRPNHYRALFVVEAIRVFVRSKLTWTDFSAYWESRSKTTGCG